MGRGRGPGWAPGGPEGFAAAPPGFRDLVARELRQMGLPGVAEEEGGARFSGGWAAVYRANLGCRVASRVLVRVARFDARGLRELLRGLAAVDWPGWLPREAAVEIRVAKRVAPAHHAGRTAEGLGEILARRVGARPCRAGQGEARVQVRIEGRRVTVSLDTSGEHLHRRGYRPRVGPAPLRENLAAGLILRAGWRGREPLLDPMCGSGTLAVEACLLALGVPPGWGRSFAFERLPRHDPALWGEIRARAMEAVRDRLPAPVFASDRDPAALERTVEAARRAGLAGHLQVALADVGELEPPAPAGLVITNPPYGRRIGQGSGAYRALGAALAGPLRGWRWAVVLSGPRDEQALGLAVGRRSRFRHGGLALCLGQGEPVSPGSAPDGGGEGG